MRLVFFILALLAFVLAIFNVKVDNLTDIGLALLTLGCIFDGSFPIVLAQK